MLENTPPADMHAQTSRRQILDSDYEGDDISNSAEHFYHNIYNKELCGLVHLAVLKTINNTIRGKN